MLRACFLTYKRKKGIIKEMERHGSVIIPQPKRLAIVTAAENCLGAPYFEVGHPSNYNLNVQLGMKPNRGLNCTGLVSYAISKGLDIDPAKWPVKARSLGMMATAVAQLELNEIPQTYAQQLEDARLADIVVWRKDPHLAGLQHCGLISKLDDNPRKTRYIHCLKTGVREDLATSAPKSIAQVLPLSQLVEQAERVGLKLPQ